MHTTRRSGRWTRHLRWRGRSSHRCTLLRTRLLIHPPPQLFIKHERGFLAQLGLVHDWCVQVGLFLAAEPAAEPGTLLGVRWWLFASFGRCWNC